MADIRGIPCSQSLALGRLIALAGIPAAFTVGKAYPALALAVDCAPAQPIPYVVTADDAGQVKAVTSNSFRFEGPVSAWVEPVLLP